jgi:hypothetical protein
MSSDVPWNVTTRGEAITYGMEHNVCGNTGPCAIECVAMEDGTQCVRKHLLKTVGTLITLSWGDVTEKCFKAKIQLALLPR